MAHVAMRVPGPSRKQFGSLLALMIVLLIVRLRRVGALIYFHCFRKSCEGISSLEHSPLACREWKPCRATIPSWTDRPVLLPSTGPCPECPKLGRLRSHRQGPIAGIELIYKANETWPTRILGQECIDDSTYQLRNTSINIYIIYCISKIKEGTPSQLTKKRHLE